MRAHETCSARLTDDRKSYLNRIAGSIAGSLKLTNFMNDVELEYFASVFLTNYNSKEDFYNSSLVICQDPLHIF